MESEWKRVPMDRLFISGLEGYVSWPTWAQADKPAVIADGDLLISCSLFRKNPPFFY